MGEWRFTVEWCSAADMPIAGALAVCKPTPTRKLVNVLVLHPWPANESLAETICHELIHAKLSPLTSLIKHSDASVMIEEGIVEDLGVLLASGNRLAARAVSRALDTMPHIRARMARYRGREKKNMVTAEQAQAALDALKSGDGAAALEFITTWIAEALAGGGAGPDSVPPAREGEPEKKEDAGPPMPREGDPGEDPAARKARLGAVDSEVLRARRGADAVNGIGIRARVRELRAEGLEIDARSEKELLDTKDIAEAERLLSWMRRGAAKAGAGGSEVRARSGALPPSADAPKVPGSPVGADALRKEGFGEQFITTYLETHKGDSAGASAMLDGARMSARKQVNPWGNQKKGDVQ